MKSRSKRTISAKNSVPDAKFDEQFSRWLDLTTQLEAPYPANVDAFVHEAALDLAYEQKKKLETWLCYQLPTNAFEAFCLVEIIRRHDEEMSRCIIEAIHNMQGWLAQHVLFDFRTSVTPTSRSVMDRTLGLLSFPHAAA